MLTMSVSIDPASLAKARQMQNWQPVLSQHLIAGIHKSLGTMQEYAIGFCFSNFANPQGTLEEAFRTEATGSMPVVGKLINDAPHSFRREYGFSGKTDRLGRYFANDPGISYMENTLRANMQVIHENVYQAVQAAFAELGV